MGVYDNRSRRGREDDVADIISDHRTTITRERKTHTDQMRGAVLETVGPFVVRIEQFKATRSASTFDEKGSNTTAAYVLIGLHSPARKWLLPRTQANSTPTFKLNDTIRDADGNEYRVTSPARWDGNVLEMNIELLG